MVFIRFFLERFDQEMNALREELRLERQEREESQKEKDGIATKRLTIENELLVTIVFYSYLDIYHQY